MPGDEFFDDEGSRVLTPTAFRFVFDSELKRAAQTHSFLTLLLLQVESEGAQTSSAESADEAIGAVAALASRELRHTDLLGKAGAGRLWLVLFDSELEGAEKVVERLAARLDEYARQASVRLSIGAACYPTNALDAALLQRHAAANIVARFGAASSSTRERRSGRRKR